MTQIFVGDTLLDLYSNTVIALTFTLGDIGNVVSRGGSYSNNIKLPITENNTRIFSNSNNSKSSFTRSKYNVSVLINGIKITTIEFAILNGTSDSYEIALYSGEVDLLNQLEEPLCSELDYGISDTLDATFFQTYADGSADVVTPVIDYGRLSTPPVNIDHFTSDSKWKNESPKIFICSCASTGNLGLSGLSAIDGYTPSEGDNVLAKDQSTPSQNGVYIATSGTWTRNPEFINIEQLQGAVVIVNFGSTNGLYMFIQASAPAYTFTFSTGFQFGASNYRTKSASWSLDGNAQSNFGTAKLPVSDFIYLEWPFPMLPQIAGTESYAFDFDIGTTILSGTVNYTIRIYLVDENNDYTAVVDQLINATGTVSVTGSVLADRGFKKIAFQALLNQEYIGFPFPQVSIVSKGYTVQVTPYTKNLLAEFNLPTVKIYKAIELILESLGDYSIEYPSGSGIEAMYKSLLLTYSREFYGLSDGTKVTDTTSVNISKFVLPDIPQKDLLIDWLFRTQSLIRNKDGLIELKPIKNIINSKSTAINWTSKRVRDNESMIFNSGKYQINYFEDVDLFKDDTDIIINNGFDDAQYDDVTQQGNTGNFTINDTTLKPVGTVYKSIFANTQLNVNNPHDVSTESYSWCPVWSWQSADRYDFKYKPKLRILYAFGSGFGLSSYYDGANQTDIRYGIYKLFSASLGAEWSNMLNNSYQPFAEAMQQYKMVNRVYNLTELDISSIDLFKLIFDDGEYFLINRIVNFVPGKLTRVELLKV